MDQRTLTYLDYVLGFILSFILSIIINRYLIRKQIKKQVGQIIREDIVKTHQIKGKTPTKGGIAIYLSTMVSSILFGLEHLSTGKFLVVLIVFTAFFILGYIDDCQKVKNKGNGLKAKSRIIFELIMTLLVLLILGYDQKSTWNINIFDNVINLGLLFIPFVIFLFLGGANAVNLTDGLDGLAGGLLLMALSPFLILAVKNNEVEIALFLMCLSGGILGFLLFNFYPAKIFMGDCGSLSVGVALAVSVFLLKQEFLFLISGCLFIIETLSVIIQIISFKLTHKRVFLMAPLHHHLELIGLKEPTIVMIFYIIGFCLSILATILGVIL